jgi:hypothetical protein
MILLASSPHGASVVVLFQPRRVGRLPGLRLVGTFGPVEWQIVRANWLARMASALTDQQMAFPIALRRAWFGKGYPISRMRVMAGQGCR